jgi:hypothetical protein
MAGDLFERLADVEVPPMPDNFDRDIHQRVNTALLVLHIAELATKGIAFAAVHFLTATWGLMIFTLSGRFGPDRRDQIR